jgi:hypothetical protein
MEGATHVHPSQHQISLQMGVGPGRYIHHRRGSADDRACRNGVSTVGLDADRIRAYVREQEHLDKQLDQGELDLDN